MEEVPSTILGVIGVVSDWERALVIRQHSQNYFYGGGTV